MKPGDSFNVRDGSIRIPGGGYICLWALQNLLPVVVLKERRILEQNDRDWVWRVHHVQCPDPQGGVVFEIRQTAEVTQDWRQAAGRKAGPRHDTGDSAAQERTPGGIRDLRVVVEEVRGRCASGMTPGDHFCVRGGRLTFPADRHFCLYALHAALPMLPAKQRPLLGGDWMKDAHHIMCPDPAGNVLMRIEPLV
jgi:uncharacterized repeat protein (TIGR04076 family)